MTMPPNKRAGGDDGIPFLFCTRRPWPAAPQHERSPMRARLTASGSLLVIAIMGGCTAPPALVPSLPQESARTTITNQTDVSQDGDERDRQVLECLALHLLTDPEFRMTMASLAEAPDARGLNVVLHCRKLGGISFELSSEDWTGANTPAGLLAGDIRAGLARRNPPPELGTKASDMPSFGHWALDHRVVIAEVSGMPAGLGSRQRFESAHPKAKGWLAAYLPGYSSNGTRALVHAWVGPSAHGACLTGLLELHGDQWAVKWRRFVYYA
jgi:hypothetical protein